MAAKAKASGRGSAAIGRATGVFDEIEAAASTSETLAATQIAMDLSDALGGRAQGVADHQYANLVESGRWWLGGLDMKWEARQQRKLYDEAGAHYYAAADALAAVIARQEQMLASANRKNGGGYKPGE